MKSIKISDSDSWEKEFCDLYERTRARVAGGERDLTRLFTPIDLDFLRSIGSKPIEMFDAVDDFVNDGEPSRDEMLEIHRMRYQHFAGIQKGFFPPLIKEYRPKPAQLGGIPWLPRAIDKVRAKLAGQLTDEFFYPCAGDRNFLRKINMSAPDFFRLVRDAPDDQEILQKITSSHA